MNIATDRLGVAKLTRLAFAGTDLHPLWHALMEKVTDDAAGAGIGMDLSVIAQLLGDQPTGLAIQKEVLTYQTLFRSPCAASRPGLRVLALAAEMDIGGNTPIEFLLEGSDVELTTLYVIPDSGQVLPPHDVAIVVAPDDPKTQETLNEIERLTAALPVLNLPHRLRALDRDRLCNLLHGLPGLIIPSTARLIRSELTDLARDHSRLPELLGRAHFPLIVRPIGSHAGRGLMKIDTPAEIEGYLAMREEAEFFLSPYVEYASRDGLFRKYRLVCVGGRPYACHMAISDLWKIWYLNADMSMSPEKRAEEAHFFETFDGGFARRHAAALEEMIHRLGLDYFQVDCAETPDGDLLVFEADNTAIVHDMDPPEVFPYKPRQMRKVFDAFVDMLYKRAGESGCELRERA